MALLLVRPLVSGMSTSALMVIVREIMPRTLMPSVNMPLQRGARPEKMGSFGWRQRDNRL
jgi:hypothetical protein